MAPDTINLEAEDILFTIYWLDHIEMSSVSEEKILAIGRVILEPTNRIQVNSPDELTLTLSIGPTGYSNGYGLHSV